MFHHGISGADIFVANYFSCIFVIETMSISVKAFDQDVETYLTCSIHMGVIGILSKLKRKKNISGRVNATNRKRRNMVRWIIVNI